MRGVKIKEPIGLWVLVAEELKAINSATFLQIESLADISQALLKKDRRSRHNWRRWLTLAAHKLSPHNGASFGFFQFNASGHDAILDNAKTVLESDRGSELAIEVAGIVMDAMFDRNSRGIPSGSTPLEECARAVYAILIVLNYRYYEGVVCNEEDSAKQRH